jgi:hypothetical protein
MTPLLRVGSYDLTTGEHNLTIGELFYLALTGLWSLVVWALFGGAITRICALALTQDEHLSLLAAVRFSASKWVSYFSSPLLPMFGSLLVVVPLLIVGLLSRSDALLAVVAVFWPLALLGGLLLAIILLGLLAGFPIMWAAVSVESSDSWDAVSRSYSYVYERPLHMLFYLFLGTVYGILILIVVNWFANMSYDLSWLPTSFGMGSEQISHLPDTFGGPLIKGLWGGVIGMVKSTFLIAYFWTFAVAAYLLLRRSADATEMDEVAMPEGATSRDLPNLAVDSAGIPNVGDEGASS